MKKLLIILGLLTFLFSTHVEAQSTYSVSFYRTGKTYKVNDLVSVNGIIYRALITTQAMPPDPDWVNISTTAGSGAGNINDGTVVGAVTIWNGTAWVETTNMTETAGNYVVLNDFDVQGTLTATNLSGTNTGDQNASQVPFTPAGNIQATDVQAAIEELESEVSVVEIDPVFVAEEPDILKTNEPRVVVSQITYNTAPLVNLTTAQIDAEGILAVPNTRWVLDKLAGGAAEVDPVYTANLPNLVQTTGDQSIAGIKTFTSPITGVDAVADTDLVTKQQLDGIQGETAIGRYDEGNGDTFYPVGWDRTYKGNGGNGALDLSFSDNTNIFSDITGSLGTQSMTLGANNKNSGYAAFTMGENNEVTTAGTHAFITGYQNVSAGYGNFTFGNYNNNDSNYSMVGGVSNETGGGATFMFGTALDGTGGDEMTILGTSNIVPTGNPYVFLIGAGTATGNASIGYTRDVPNDAFRAYRTGALEAPMQTNAIIGTIGDQALITKKYFDDNAAGGGTTNLGYTASPTDGTVTSSTGTDATLPLATGVNAGLLAPADFTKLAGIESGATADQVASEVPFTPTGNTTSSDVQAAIVEIQTELDGVAGSTNLSYTASPTNGIVASDTGTDATITLADGVNAGLITPAEKTLIASAIQTETDPVYISDPAFSITASDITNLGNLSGTNTGDQDLSAYALDNVTSTTGGAAYTTNSTDNGNHIVMTGATPVVTLDDASVNVGNQFTIYNKTGEDVTWAFGTGDGAYQGSLPTLPDGSYAWATLESANNWSVVVGGTAGSGGGSSTLSGLTDTNISSPLNGQALVYNSSGGNWENQTLAGTGDMLKSTYDSDADDIVDNAEAVGGVAITDIARTDVAETFSSTISATNLSGTNTGDNAVNSLYSGLVSNATHTGDVTGATALTISTDAVDIPMLSATGTADATTFLRGDNTWAVPSGGGGGDVFLANDQTFTGSNTFTNIATQFGGGVSSVQDYSVSFYQEAGDLIGQVIMNSADEWLFQGALGVTTRFTGFNDVEFSQGIRVANDPTTDDGVGDRLYNDNRYTAKPSDNYALDTYDGRWTYGSGWSNGTDKITGSNAFGNLHYSDGGITQGDRLKVSITIENYTSGTLTMKAGQYEDALGLLEIDSDGTYTYMLEAVDNTEGSITFTIDGYTNFYGDITDVRVEKLGGGLDAAHRVQGLGQSGSIIITDNGNGQFNIDGSYLVPRSGFQANSGGAVNLSGYNTGAYHRSWTSNSTALTAQVRENTAWSITRGMLKEVMIQEGTQKVTFSGTTDGVTIRSQLGSSVRTNGQWAVVEVLWIASNEVIIRGDIEVAP